MVDRAEGDEITPKRLIATVSGEVLEAARIQQRSTPSIQGGEGLTLRNVTGDRVQDVFVFVGPRKVFYQSNRKASDPKKLEFSFDVELTPGTNVITVVARENEDTASRQTVVVRRDGPGGEPLPTPKGESLGEDFGLGTKE